MKKFIPVLMETKLFDGVMADDIEAMLSCLQTTLCTYKKGEHIYRQGDNIHRIAVPVEGSIIIQNFDYWGNRSIINMIGTGEMFGEAYAAPDSGAMTNDVIASEDCTVMFFDINRILTVCSSACRFHTTVVQNLVFALSEKNRKLMQKLGHMSKRTTREKLISYLSEQARKNGSGSFTIPFNRQQLADFLSVDRSAMSNELCRLRDNGMIEFEKNRFVLKYK